LVNFQLVATLGVSQEEAFVRKLEEMFIAEGPAAFKKQGLMQRFKRWLNALLDRVLGRPVKPRTDEELYKWGRFWALAVQNGNYLMASDESVPVDSVRQSKSRSQQAIRHAELEAKHNAGTITAAETAEAQALVDEKAKSEGYYVDAFHGTNSKFNAFSRGKIGAKESKDNKLTFGRGMYGDGFYFAPAASAELVGVESEV